LKKKSPDSNITFSTKTSIYGWLGEISWLELKLSGGDLNWKFRFVKLTSAMIVEGIWRIKLKHVWAYLSKRPPPRANHFLTSICFGWVTAVIAVGAL
jgi:hypothetical protein